MSSLDKITKERLKKRKSLKERGENPYPILVNITHKIGELIDNFSKFSKNKKRVKTAGRLMSLRQHGGLTFGDLQDGEARIQLAFHEDALGKNLYAKITEFVDVGDFLQVEGILFKTKRGEKSLNIAKYGIITKSIRPLPEKWHGLKDVELRYRTREMDLLMNSDVKEIFKKRSLIINSIREFLDENKFMEVEVPILQLIPGGTSAIPFVTHLNAWDLDVFLRIAPEIYLKRLLVGGFDKVYEMGRNFRNEGVDYTHNPEFTMLEFYWAYSNYKEGMKFTEELLRRVAKQVFGKLSFECSSRHGETGEGKSIDFSKSFKRVEFNELLQKYAGINYEDYNFESLLKKAKELGVKIEKKVFSKGEVADSIYKKICQPKLIQPTFVIHYPTEMKPLAKPLETNPSYAANVQLVVAGLELVNAYSELNDPIVQQENFKQQAKLRAKGNKEAQPFDKEFLESLEYGMPPAFGFGMGIDRLVALLTNSHSLREVILFPTMRPK